MTAAVAPVATTTTSAGTTAFTGTALHLRLALRLERVRLVVWPAVILGLLWAMGDSMRSLYPDQAARDTYAQINDSSPVIKAINGPGYALDTAGGIVVFEVGGYLLVVAALMAVSVVVRSTRAEEASGRAELALSGATGAVAQLAAGMLVALGASVLTGLGATAVLVSLDLPASGALLYGAGLAMVGGVLTGVAAVAAQLAPQPSTVLGLSGIVVAVGYVLRAVGDIGDGPWSSFSPFGWAQATAPFATGDDGPGERWSPLLVGVAVTAALLVVALVVRRRRDLGAALLKDRPGRASAAPALTGAVAVSMRDARGSILGWSVGAFLVGAVFGGAGEEISDVFAASDGIGDLLGMDESSATDGYLTFAMLLLAFTASGFGVSLAARLHADERTGVAELVLSTTTSRARWLGAGALTAAVGSAAVLLAAGLGIGGGYALVTQDAGQLWRVVGATALYIPAAWLLVAILLVLVGWLPRWTALAWAALGTSVVVSLLGSPLGLSDQVMRISPFEHLPGLPLDAVGAAPLVMLGAAVLLVAGAVRGMQVRDLG